MWLGVAFESLTSSGLTSNDQRYDHLFRECLQQFSQQSWKPVTETWKTSESPILSYLASDQKQTKQLTSCWSTVDQQLSEGERSLSKTTGVNPSRPTTKSPVNAFSLERQKVGENWHHLHSVTASRWIRSLLAGQRLDLGLTMLKDPVGWDGGHQWGSPQEHILATVPHCTSMSLKIFARSWSWDPKSEYFPWF